jgi:peptidoglycan/xylan/chitin deacetylase (PgdA/CDA1 family)
MTALRRLLAGPAAGAMRLYRLARPGPAGLRILMFHDTRGGRLKALDGLVSRLAERDLLCTPDAARAFLDGGSMRDTRFLLTFDDGFASNRVAAEQVLRKWDAHALFFVCPGLMEHSAAEQPAAIARTIYDGARTAGSIGENLMDWRDLERLVELGHTVGSHTMHHRRLSVLDAETREEEVGRAASILKRRFGSADWFAYPFGDVGSIDPASLRAVGMHHRFCRAGVRGSNQPGIHPLALRADSIDLDMPAGWGDLVLQGAFDWRYRAARAALDGMIEPG